MSAPVNICAIAKNEGRYIREWVLFHQLVGVLRIVVYDNASTDDTLAQLQPFVDSGFVYVVPWPMANPSQFAAYQDYVDKHCGQQAWTAFVDCDEFLFSPTHPTITQAIDRILARLDEPIGAIGVNWLCFGASGRQEYSPEPVIERFTWRDLVTNPVNTHIKSLVWMDQPRIQVGGTPHHFLTSMGTVDELGREVPGSFTGSHSSELLRINHYSSKSRQEWLDRSKLGKADRATMEIDPRWWSDRQAMEVEDREIQRWLPELKKRLETQNA